MHSWNTRSTRTTTLRGEHTGGDLLGIAAQPFTEKELDQIFTDGIFTQIDHSVLLTVLWPSVEAKSWQRQLLHGAVREVDSAVFLWLRINSTALIINQPSGSNLTGTKGVAWVRSEDRPELAQKILETDIQQRTTQDKTC